MTFRRFDPSDKPQEFVMRASVQARAGNGALAVRRRIRAQSSQFQ
jgi:hypothetical protein